ncbi:hypothetical protein GCM10010269_15990 [Streptomyces humidus]|uniref:Uncharacterized protein n=1 Tax=Streptomyces humidus TaxID=52259 RepID=A0A918FSP3_9ACTN|nr:hypothetical protein [Streptomyces humidus]GGR77528.1 hypothetical protein GCM10010269_15990 [Streptomyces humidus]
MRRPVTGEVHVHYSQIYVESDPGGTTPGLLEAFAGQSGGLCGAAVPGALRLHTGLHTGDVGFVVEVHDAPPAVDPDWEEVVEVSFRPVSERTSLVQWAGEAAWDLDLSRTDHRVRYCARGMDRGRERGTRVTGEPRADSYLLQFWPAPPRPDRVIRQTSQIAAYWHRYARELPPQPTPERRAETERLARRAQERAAEERRVHHERWQWGGRLPSQTLRDARESNVLGLLRFDSDLVHALDAAGPRVQRAVALLAARRACEAAGLTDVPWVAEALTALAHKRPLPPPFDDRALLSQTLRSDPRVPDRSVLEAIPPQRPPYRPPTPADRPLHQQQAPPAAAGGKWVSATKSGEDPPSRPGLGRAPGTLASTAPADRSTTSTTGTGHDAAVVVHTRGTPREPSRISQPHFALPAVLAAAEPVPLKAALDAVWHALNTYGEHYPELLEEVRSAHAEGTGE